MEARIDQLIDQLSLDFLRTQGQRNAYRDACADLAEALEGVLAMPEYDGTRATSVKRRETKIKAYRALAMYRGELK